MDVTHRMTAGATTIRMRKPRARHRTMLYQRSERGLNGVLTHSAETLNLAWGHHHSLRRPICIKVFCKPIKHLFHVENNAVDMERKMTFQQGVSGNPGGNRHRTRHLLNQEFMQALLLNFRHQGKKAIEKVARNQPAAYLKILALLVPREMKFEHTAGVKAMTDEQIERGIALIKEMLAQREAGANAKVIEGVAEPAALSAPKVVPDGPNNVMDAADTAVGASERKPRKRKAPSTPGA